MLRSLMVKTVLALFVLLSGMIVPTSASGDDILVYISNIGDTDSVILRDLDTGEERAIITHPGIRGNRTPQKPVFSADGRIAYAAYNDDDYEIYVWDEGILTNLGQGFNPAWSADGRLAFHSDRGENREIYVWDEGTITNISQSPSVDEAPLWSADGRIAFLDWSTWETYVWDEGARTSLGPHTDQAAWSPDGRLAFRSFRNPAALSIWEDGTVSTIPLPDIGNLIGDLVWSVDGRLAFKAGDDNTYEIYMWDGETITNLSQGTAGFDVPVWSVDGRLAFVSQRDGNFNIYVWDEGIVTNVSQSSSGQRDPAWSADGRLAFSNGEIYIWDDGTLTTIATGILPQWLPSLDD